MSLQDLEDTAGSWDLYGQEDTKRYPGIQAEFFERAAGPLTRRNAILGFVGLGATLPLAQLNYLPWSHDGLRSQWCSASSL